MADAQVKLYQEAPTGLPPIAADSQELLEREMLRLGGSAYMPQSAEMVD
jgi:hypothetical protein